MADLIGEPDELEGPGQHETIAVSLQAAALAQQVLVLEAWTAVIRSPAREISCPSSRYGMPLKTPRMERA
ncbi:hypothetical protein [Xanthomonas hortorum]|uniref:Uncharacterized protein n=1 Tax=Xanthomonas hortorum pv. hederae TaxID=453603 RepID=A0A9X4H689_9XANT|nr:hypothetical protein [Xanthomonas hortorum]MDC8638741.1 hypothetical protein [Xanthomonas hortorum pv. hederae]PPU86260.1 hypothetical protein XhhCFBP4925_00600 [Xanthomonas hortorum pv. hederae]PUF01387.1 hypothetical protein C7T87_03470 [Xanthomonas hortorum pv. hederae]